jgi:hypothetical protein
MDPFCPFRRRPAMSMVLHPFVITSRELARWLDSQPDCWWSAGPDDSLISRVNFPVPGDEFAEALREIDRNIIIHTDKAIGLEDGRQISGEELPLLAETRNRYQNRCFLASWEGSDKMWFISEDKWAAKALADDATEDEDAEAENGSQPEDW